MNQKPYQQAGLQGLILFGLIAFAAALLYEQGLIDILLAGDRSRLSIIIAAIWLGMSLRWLYLLFWYDRALDLSRDIDRGRAIDQEQAKRWMNHGWFAADAVLKIGLLGTIIGFILMLAPIRELLNFDPASLQIAIQKMSAGMAVALYTTLSGLVANLLLRLQYQILADRISRASGPNGESK